MTTDSINHHENAPALVSALTAVEKAIAGSGFDPKLRHLVVLRASQLNGCGFCVRMHTREAREDGETNARLDQLVVWRHSREFTEREKAALAWVEALTQLSQDNYGSLRASLRAHFSETELTTLTTIVGMINLWNRVQVSNH